MTIQTIISTMINDFKTLTILSLKNVFQSCQKVLEATYRDVDVPVDRLLDEDGARVEVYGDLGEYVEDH